MSTNFEADRLVCERFLERTGARRPTTVAVRLFEPVFSPHDCRGDYVCPFEIDGLGESIRDHGCGVDTLQSFIAAATHATYALWPVRTELRWLDAPYETSIADLLQIDDAGRRRRVQAILDEQDYALAQAAIATEQIRRAKPSQPAEQTDLDAYAAENNRKLRKILKAERDASAQGRAESSKAAPIATRRLKSGFRIDVLLRVWRPVRRRGRGPTDLYQADFQVVGLAGSERSSTMGVDSMQAIFNAIHTLEMTLRPWRDSLTWFDFPYDDPALFISVLDAGRRRRIHAVIDEELYAIDELRRDRQLFQEQWRAQSIDTELR